MKDFLMKNKWKVAIAVLVIFGVARACGYPAESDSTEEAGASYYSNGNN